MKQTKKVSMIAIAIAATLGFAGSASADESFMMTVMNSGATTNYGAAGFAGLVTGAAGTNGFFGITFTQVDGQLQGQAGGEVVQVGGGVGGNALAQIVPGAANAGSTSQVSVGGLVVNGVMTAGGYMNVGAQAVNQ